MNQFEKVPEEVLGIELKEFEGDVKTLAQLLAEATEQYIENCKYIVTAKDDKVDLSSFVAWTKDYILNLKNTEFGYYVIMMEREKTGD